MAEIVNPFETKEKKDSLAYRLEEMSEAIQKSIDNIERVINEEVDLEELVKKADEEGKFEEFVKETEDQVDKLKTQLQTLIEKKETLDEVVESCRNNEEIDSVVTLLLRALGIFETNG